MATTTNYGWTTPNDTDLVKDGAAAIRTLGSSVDTTTKNLNPETTLGDLSFRSATSNINTRIPIGSSGQHLTVVAGVPAWATASDQTPLTTKGDLLGFSTLDARIPIGANATVLTADSTEALGLKWATPAGGGATFVGAVVHNSTAQSISNNTYTTLLFDAETLDTNTFHNTSTNTGRFTIPSGKNGVYAINIYFANGVSTTGVRVIKWRKNGADYNYTRTNQDVDTETIRAALTISLVATDYIEAQYFQNAGTSQNVDITIDYCQYSITYLGA